LWISSEILMHFPFLLIFSEFVLHFCFTVCLHFWEILMNFLWIPYAFLMNFLWNSYAVFKTLYVLGKSVWSFGKSVFF
jgi:hypothetical protein